MEIFGAGAVSARARQGRGQKPRESYRRKARICAAGALLILEPECRLSTKRCKYNQVRDINSQPNYILGILADNPEIAPFG